MDGLWFRRFAPEARGRIRLICFPHAGGAASSYSALARALSPHVDVLSIQYPGRQDRRNEPPIADLHALATRIADRLPAGPHAFFGHSMGAIVAYEVARRLGGTAPTRLFASGRAAPSVPNGRHVHLRDDRELVRDVRLLGGAGNSALDDPELLAMILPPLRADYTAIETYRWTPGPPLACPVTVLIGDEDPLVDIRDARVWHDHTHAGITLRPYPGGHFYLERQPDHVARDLLDDLGVTELTRP
jgi:pyochelin biosynthesis protein PchC